MKINMYKKRIAIIILMIGVVCSMLYFTQGAKRTYNDEITYGLNTYKEADPGILTEEDLKLLPGPVQKYLRYTGVVGKPKIWNFRGTFDGRMKTNNGWMNITAEQYNFFKNPTRMFYIKGGMFGIPFYGIHAYKDQTGYMLIKALGLIPVVNGRGPEMNQGDCVTLFNDMCLLAPASLIDKRIIWETVDDLTVKAKFCNGSITVSAVLYFNGSGELINFESDDRYLSNTGATYEKLRWSTPIKEYRDMDGVRLASNAEAVWTMADGSLFKYAGFIIKSIEYNCTDLK